MVNWIDEREDDEDEEETFNCPSCNSALGFDEGDFCPVCGESLDDGDADAEAVDALERCGDEYAEHEGNAT